MKKIKLIAPILGLTTAATLGSTLVSCGPDTPAEEPTFTVDQTVMYSAQEAEIEVQWDNGDKIDFKGFEFSCIQEKKVKVDIIGEEESNPQKLKLTFSSPITDVVKGGVLSFQYDNISTGKKGISVQIRDVTIIRIHYVLDTWNSEETKDWLIKTDVSMTANTKTRIQVDLSKFSESIKNPLFCLGSFTEDPGIDQFTINVYYDGAKIDNVEGQATQPEKEGPWEVDIPIHNHTFEVSKTLFFEITYTKGITGGWLSFEDYNTGE